MRIHDHEPIGFLESMSGDLESGLDELVFACAPIQAIKALAIDIRPIERICAAVPKWTFAQRSP
jgi:hypothetical protein